MLDASWLLSNLNTEFVFLEFKSSILWDNSPALRISLICDGDNWKENCSSSVEVCLNAFFKEKTLSKLQLAEGYRRLLEKTSFHFVFCLFGMHMEYKRPFCCKTMLFLAELKIQDDTVLDIIGHSTN